MAYLAVFYYLFNINHTGSDDVDYLEIMNFCGYDMDKAHEMAKQRGTEDFSELLKRMRGSTQQEQEGKDVHILPA